MTHPLDPARPGDTVALLYRGFAQETPKRIVSRSDDRINLEDGTHLCRHPQSETPSLREWRVSWPCWYTIA
jgi:hypothetical protein